MKIKILGLSSSPRRGNTLIMVHEALKAAREIGDVETTLYSFKGKEIAPCIDCDLCPVSDEQLCAQDDSMTELYPLLTGADGIIMGSPVYCGTINAQLKSMMDRCRPLGRIGSPMMYKVGGGIAVGACRGGGQDNTIKDIIYFFMLEGIFPVGLLKQLQIGAMGLAWRPAAIMDDKWKADHLGRDVPGLEEARDIGRRVAICTKIVKAGLQNADPSQYHEQWDFDRDKIPNLKEARKRARQIEKELGIEYI